MKLLATLVVAVALLAGATVDAAAAPASKSEVAKLRQKVTKQGRTIRVLVTLNRSQDRQIAELVDAHNSLVDAHNELRSQVEGALTQVSAAFNGLATRHNGLVDNVIALGEYVIALGDAFDCHRTQPAHGAC
jgi:hypothetical protein